MVVVAEPRRMHPPTQAELDALVDALPTPLNAFALVAAWSGLRLSEVADLRWGDIGDGLVVVRAGKGNKRRESVLLDPGMRALDLVRPMVGGELVVPHPESNVFRNMQGRPFTRKTVNKHWCRAREAAGLERFVTHDLRKFHATYLINRGVSETDIAVQLGHLDKHGRPNTELVRRVYAFVAIPSSLERVREAGNA